MNQRIPKKSNMVVHHIPGSDETVLLDEYKNQLLVLNEVGAGVWYLVDGTRSVEKIVDEIVEVLPASRHQVQQDVDRFLADLEGRELIKF